MSSPQIRNSCSFLTLASTALHLILAEQQDMFVFADLKLLVLFKNKLQLGSPD
jgi:hypothetical protein